MWSHSLDTKLIALVQQHVYDFNAVAEDVQKETHDLDFDSEECRVRFSTLEEQSDKWEWTKVLDKELCIMARSHTFNFEEVAEDLTQKAQVRDLCEEGAIATADKCRQRYFKLDSRKLKRRTAGKSTPKSANVPEPGAAAAAKPTPVAAKPEEDEDEDDEDDEDVTGEVFSEVRHNWYQTNADVVVTLLQKGLREEDVVVDFAENRVQVVLSNLDGPRGRLRVRLYAPVTVAECQCKVLETKVELRLRKQDAGCQWATLQRAAGGSGGGAEGGGGGGASAAKLKQIPQPQAQAQAKNRPYASTKDWEKVGRDIDRELDKDDLAAGVAERREAHALVRERAAARQKLLATLEQGTAAKKKGEAKAKKEGGGGDDDDDVEETIDISVGGGRQEEKGAGNSNSNSSTNNNNPMDVPNAPFPERFKPKMSDVEKLLERLGENDDDDDGDDFTPVSRADLLKKMFASDGQTCPESLMNNSMPLDENFTKMFGR